jgi:hypothetical protein
MDGRPARGACDPCIALSFAPTVPKTGWCESAEQWLVLIRREIEANSCPRRGHAQAGRRKRIKQGGAARRGGTGKRGQVIPGCAIAGEAGNPFGASAAARASWELHQVYALAGRSKLSATLGGCK